MPANLHVHIGDENPFSKQPVKKARKIAAASDHIWIGEAAFLMAIIKKNEELYIPSFISLVLDLIPLHPVILLTPELIHQIRNFSGENKTRFSIASPKTVANFLEKHLDDNAYSVAW